MLNINKILCWYWYKKEYFNNSKYYDIILLRNKSKLPIWILSLDYLYYKICGSINRYKLRLLNSYVVNVSSFSRNRWHRCSKRGHYCYSRCFFYSGCWDLYKPACYLQWTALWVLYRVENRILTIYNNKLIKD